MNPTESDLSYGGGESLAKILRKRKGRRSIALSDLRCEHQLFTIGRTSAGSGSHWVTTNTKDHLQAEQTWRESFTASLGRKKTRNMSAQFGTKNNMVSIAYLIVPLFQHLIKTQDFFLTPVLGQRVGRNFTFYL